MPSQNSLLEIGSKFGDYTVVKLLGKGAMGEVYKIVDGDAVYALKIMKADIADKEKAHEWRKRFAREAEIAMNIRHKNLIEVYDVGEDPETHLCYILMEYVGGGTLTDRLKKKGKLSIDEAVKIMMHIANGLDEAHKAGVVHRDIKPDNIMFTTDGVPKLADLGIARVKKGGIDTTVTRTDMIVGTPAYMSPEQMLNSHDVDARADIYSLGVVFYEMLTGARPNQNSTIVELMAKAIKGEELPDVRNVRPEVSASLAYALSRLVAQDAEKRPQTAAEAAKLVYDAASGKILVKKVRPGNAGRKTDGNEELRIKNEELRKWNLRSVLCAAGGLLLAVIAIGALFMSKPKPLQVVHENRPVVEKKRIVERVYVTNVVNVVSAKKDPADKRGMNVQKKTIELIPRLDRDKKAWAYSFDREEGWEKPEFNDRNWRRAQGGFGHRDWQWEIRWGTINTEWRTRNVFLRRHFKWEGGDVSRVVFEIFHDDGVKVILNGKTVMYKGGAYSWWMHYECPAARFNKALKKGDNVICFEVENESGPCYFDAGLFVEKGGKPPEYYDIEEVRHVKTKEGTWTVKIEGGIAQIGSGRDKALSPEPIGELEIPSELGGLKIRKIGQDAFKDCRNLRRVKIPEGVNILGHGVFMGCHNLEEISIPESLEYIGAKMIFHAQKLKKLDIKNVRLLWDETFDACDIEELGVNPGNPTFYVEDGVLYDRVRKGIVVIPDSRTSYTVPNGIETVYSEAFQGTKIKSLVLPESIRLLGNAFCNSCPEIESIEFKCDTCLINGWSMPDCPKLKRVVLPRKLKWLDSTMFANDISLESIEIPDTVTRIGVYAFSGCTRLKYVRGGKGVEHIVGRAFQSCHSLESIVLPASLKTTDDRVFNDCCSLKTVYFEGDAPRVGERFYENTNPTLVTYVRHGSRGWNGPGSTDLPDKWPVGDPDARPIRYMDDRGENISADKGEKTLGESAKPNLKIAAPATKVAEANGYHWFYRIEKGKAVLCKSGDRPCIVPKPTGKVVVPKRIDERNVIAIDHQAFANCDGMTEIVLPEGLKEIRGNSTFYRCNGLREVTLPRSLENVWEWAFDECEGLKKVNVGNLAVYRARGSFGCQFIGCYNIEEFACAKSNPKYKVVNGAIYTKDMKELAAYPKTRDEIKLPKSVKILGWCSMTGFRRKHVIVPEGVEEIKAWAFEKSQGTETIEFPKSLKRLGASQFKWNSALRKVVFHGDAPELTYKVLFEGVAKDVIVYVPRGSKGWNGPGSTDLPEKWPVGDPDARPIRYIDE